MAKIVHISENESQLIARAKENDRNAQRVLFENYASKMLSICRYYITDIQFAEDVMLKGFLKVFSNLNSFEGKSSFYTWIKRVMTHQCLDHLRSQQKKWDFVDIDEKWDYTEPQHDINIDLSELQVLIDRLPNGCKAVFNLYVLEDFAHQEIAEKLNISIGTSKSQLSYARKFLQQQLKNRNHV